MNKNSGLRKNLYILIFLNFSLLLFGIFYTAFFFEKGDAGEFSCAFKSYFGLYCPGCGGSRSLYHFLRFEFFKSFIYYPPIIIGALVILDYDARLIITLIKKSCALTDRFKYYTFILIPISIVINFILRNLLLILFKIDTVGDII